MSTSSEKFQRIGDIAIFNKSPSIEADTLERLGVKTICLKGPIIGDLRTPNIKVLAGNGTETIHTEDGCLYKLDVAKVMFSKGNVNERHRPAKLVKPKEVVVDMFAGIGYFTIPIAKAWPDCKVYAIEMNPDSLHYLRENIKLNKLDNVTVIEGDCSKVSVPEKADRVHMGYLPGTEKFLPAAFGFLGNKGMVHFHNTYKESELWDNPRKVLVSEGEKAGYKLDNISHEGKVKQFAPRVWHIVIDAEFTSS